MEFVPSFVQGVSRELMSESRDSILPLYPGVFLEIGRFGEQPMELTVRYRTGPFSLLTSSGRFILQTRNIPRSVPEKDASPIANRFQSFFFPLTKLTHRPSERSAQESFRFFCSCHPLTQVYRHILRPNFRDLVFPVFFGYFRNIEVGRAWRCPSTD